MAERLSKEKEFEVIKEYQQLSKQYKQEPQDRQDKLDELRQRVWEELLMPHSGLVHSIATNLCKKYECWDLKEKLISEGYDGLIAALDTFDEKKGCRFSTHAYQRAWGKMMNFLTEQRFAPANKLESLDTLSREDDDGPFKELASALLTPEGELTCKERAALLARALKELPEHYRTVLILHHVEDLNLEELAERLDVSLSAIKSRLFHARTKLRALLCPLFAIAPSHSGMEVKQNA